MLSNCVGNIEWNLSLSYNSVLDGRPVRTEMRNILARNITTTSGVSLNSNDIYYDVENGWSEEDSMQSTKNEAEAMAAVELAQGLITGGARQNQIRILAPYTAQVNTIKRKLAIAGLTGVASSTIDSNLSEGCDYGILSLTRAGDKTGFMDKEFRMLVALTRFRYLRYVLGRHHFWINRREESDVKAFAFFMQQNDKVRVMNVANAPEAPATADTWAIEPRPQRPRAPRPDRDNGEERPRRVRLPEVTYDVAAMADAQTNAQAWYATYDANDEQP